MRAARSGSEPYLKFRVFGIERVVESEMLKVALRPRPRVNFAVVTLFIAWAWFDAYPMNFTVSGVLGLVGFLLFGYGASAVSWRRGSRESVEDTDSESEEKAGVAMVDLAAAVGGIALICFAFWLPS